MGTNDWETEIYGRGRQVNRWPFSDVVSDVTRLTAGADRSALSVLDLGCGAGNNVWFFLDSGFEVCGIDIAPSAIKIALDRIRALGYPEPDLRVGDIAHLPWSDGRFDLVVDRGTISQVSLEDVEKTLAEVHRVLKPGGIFLSYNLFGWNNSGRSHGLEVAPRSFGGFTGGRFQSKSPMTTFFDKSLIYDLWSPLRVTQLLRHEVTTDGSDTVEEYYTVHGLKAD
jgi:SAM-dependent methyltransferase